MEKTRTTLELPEGGHRRLRVLAASLGMTMGSAVDVAVRESLAARGVLSQLTMGDDPALARGEVQRRRCGGQRQRKAI